MARPKPMGRVNRADFARKPPHGAPCNRCGVCCMVALCDLGQILFGQKLGRCPALERESPETYRCGVVRDPATYSIRTAIYGEERMRQAAKLIIYAGDGCDSRFNGEPINHVFQHICEIKDRCDRDKRKAALELWGIE
jgi:hypothetical protein